MVQDISSFHGSVNDTAGSLAVTDVDDFHIVICESFQKLRSTADLWLSFPDIRIRNRKEVRIRLRFLLPGRSAAFTSRRAVLVSWCTP